MGEPAKSVIWAYYTHLPYIASQVIRYFLLDARMLPLLFDPTQISRASRYAGLQDPFLRAILSKQSSMLTMLSQRLTDRLKRLVQAKTRCTAHLHIWLSQQ